MEAHEKIYFDFLLNTAVERFTERVIQRKGGPAAALAAIRQEPEAEGVWLSQFVDSFFEDILLGTPAGAVFVLEALEKRPIEAQAAGKLGEVLGRMAKAAFRKLLWEKAQESLEQSLAYG
jgi:hypothetical protein